MKKQIIKYFALYLLQLCVPLFIGGTARAEQHTSLTNESTWYEIVRDKIPTSALAASYGGPGYHWGGMGIMKRPTMFASTTGASGPHATPIPNTTSRDGSVDGNTIVHGQFIYTLTTWSSGGSIQIRYNLDAIEYPDGEILNSVFSRTHTIGLTYSSGVVTATSSPGRFQTGALVYFANRTWHAPIINGVRPVEVESAVPGYITSVDLGSTIDIVCNLEDNQQYNPLYGIATVKSGFYEQLLDWVNHTATELPPAGHYHLRSVSGEPMNDGTHITGIGKSVWRQRVTDFDGDSTEFDRDVTIRTENKPNIILVYDTGDLEGTPFTDGTANGGVNGWSNVPLKALVHTDNGAGNLIVDGYYFNQLNDNHGSISHGNAQKTVAEKQYDTETDGTNVTGVMVDVAKTTELSATTDPVTLKIDLTNPIAGVHYNTGTETLINDSSDALSGLQSTQVAIVQAGEQPPADTDYHDFSNWQSLIGGNGHYDIYIIATDNAGNKATTMLANQLLSGSSSSLEISKTVSGQYGSYHKEFEVTISLEDEQGNAVNDTYAVSSSLVDVNDYTVTFTNGKGIISIKHDETISMQGLPTGYTYTVKETDIAVVNGNALYDVTYNGVSSDTGVTGVLDGSATQVAIRNVRDSVPDMGIADTQSILFVGSSLLLLTLLSATFVYCNKKKNNHE